MAFCEPVPLRSSHESLGGYIVLPRLIDKVRLLAKGDLPEPYAANVLGAEYTLDGRFLSFTGLDAEALRQAILSHRTDDEVLAWVQHHAKRATLSEIQAWAKEVDSYRPDAALVEYRRRLYPDLSARIDVTCLSVLDLIDIDEGRLPIKN